MKYTHTIIKSFILFLALTTVSLTAQARDSLEALRTDLNAALSRITTLESQNTAQQSQINGLKAKVDAVPVFYAIGDVGPAGGIVFQISDAGIHGLEAAPVDQGAAPWGCGGLTIPGANGTAVGTGKQNTADILAGCNQAGIAAQLAADYSLGGFDDWHLPSRDELNLLYQQKAVVGGFADEFYWSSSEFSSGTFSAWTQWFFDGQQLFNGYKPDA